MSEMFDYENLYYRKQSYFHWAVLKQEYQERGEMFVILVNYIKPLTEIDAKLEAHRRFLAEGYAPSIDEIKAYMSRDPFNEAGVAQYEVLEFNPMKSDPRIRAILKY